MQRVHWAAETHDAYVVEGLLRANGIVAWTFDAGIVRLDWLKTLAFGGCRVMVADSDAEPAWHIVNAYRRGEFALADEEIDRPRCPACLRSAGQEDRRPRRAIFLLLAVSDWIFSVLFLLIRSPGTMALFLAACVAFNVILVFPGLAAWAVKSRFLCTNCARAWRAPRPSYQAMSRAVEDGLDERARPAARARRGAP